MYLEMEICGGAERVDYFGQIRVSSAAGSTGIESNHVNVWLGNGHQDYQS